MDLIKEIERNSRSVPLLELDNSFIPAVLWNKEYSRRAQKDAGQRLISISISRAGGKSLYGFNKILLPDNADISGARFGSTASSRRFYLAA